MAEFDPFEREFRRQASGLRRTPSSRSWDRIERRLDRRASGGNILSIRPWMIAAFVLIVAGTFVLSNVVSDNNNLLAQRSQGFEELSNPYTPEEAFVPKDYHPEQDAGEDIVRDEGFRDVMVSKKHRVTS